MIHELHAGALRLSVRPDLGGSVAGLWHRETPILRSTEPVLLAESRSAAMYPLLPYSNRLGYRRFRWKGHDYTTRANVPDSPHSLHGIGWQRPWRIVSSSAIELVLGLDHPGDADWPFAFEARQYFTLAPESFSARLLFTNTASVEQPAGLGWHPYFVKRARSRLHVAVPCEWLADRVRRSMLMPAVRELRVIPFGVDLDVFRAADRPSVRAGLGLDPSRRVMLVAANALRERTWKDSEAFRGALERLRGEAAAAQWIALGEEGPDLQVGAVRLRRVAMESDDRQLSRWYQAADAYVHPARADTYPLMVIEALACGTPVIGTAVGGVPEQIASASFIRGAHERAGLDEATGAVVPAGDPLALVAAIEGTLALNSGVRAALSANAARTAREKFDRRRHAREYLDWIHALVAERSGSPREQPR